MAKPQPYREPASAISMPGKKANTSATADPSKAVPAGATDGAEIGGEGE